ncbi:MAG: tetratricopeptide repeat protein [Porphyromonas sp.]|nr:tetratricopeptide repeat protein [Porphyromonas sp.]
MTRQILRLLICCLMLGLSTALRAQIDVEHVISIGRNALYFNDYVVSIGYFNRAIDTRPWLAEPYLYRSIAKISLEDYNGAAEDASESIRLNPYISRSYLIRGVAYQNTNRLEEAIEDYKRGIALAPDNAQMRYNQAVAELRLKRLADAEQSLEELLRYSNKYNEAHALRATIALERQDTTLALQRIAEALRIDPGMSLPYRLKASIDAERKAWGQAIENLSRAIDLDGADAELYTNRAILHYHNNNLRASMADYSRALELDPKNEISLNNRAILYQQVGEQRLALADWNRIISLQPRNYIARFNRAMLSLDLGEGLRTAVADLDSVLRQYPSFADGFIQRALLKSRLGDKRGANADYWHANELMRNQSRAQQAHAQALSNQRRMTKTAGDTSIDKYALLIEGERKHTPDTRYESKARGRVQDRDVAVEQRPMYYLTFFLPLDADGKPLSVKPHYSPLIEQYNSVGDSLRLRLQATPLALSSEQIATLQAELSTAEDKGQLRYYLRRGIIHSLLQDYEQAILDYNRALALDGQNALALWARSIASMRHSEAKSSQAVAQLDGALRGSATTGQTRPMAPRSPKALDLVPSAMQDLGQLLMLQPDFAYGYYNRAVLYAQNGEAQQAVADYSRALELQPQLAEAYYNRGLLYLSLAKTEEGIRDLSKAGELGIYEAYNIIKRMK